MAKIKKEDLEHLSSDEIRKCFTEEDRTKLPSPIKEYIEEGKESYTMAERSNRVEKLLSSIIINRFINNTL